MKCPTHIETDRLVIRKPTLSDAKEIFERYAGDPEVGRYLAWPTHDSVADTRAFLEFSDDEWARWPAGPYLVFSLADGQLLGSTGVAFEFSHRAATGYVLARDSWGKGFATEAVGAMKSVASIADVRRLYALCHPDHRASQRVLEKSGFEKEGTLRRYCEFPNLEPGILQDVQCFSYIFPE